MPVPVVVYVVAVVGTVGAAIAFKEFVYKPHIAPAVGRWQEERRMRRTGMMHHADTGSGESDDDGDDMPLLERRPRRSSVSSSRTTSSHGSLDESRGPTSLGFGSGEQMFRSGVLRRRRPRDADNDSTIELDNLANVIEARRNNNANGRSTMDESIHAIPYVPLSPHRTHVLFDSASPSPSTTANPSRVPSIPTTPAAQPTALDLSGGEESTKRAESSVREVPHYFPQLVQQPLTPAAASVAASLNGSPGGLSSLAALEESVIEVFPSPVAQLSADSELSLQLSPLDRSSSLNASTFLTHPLERALSPPVVLSPPAHNIPSLSQSYPQDLDYEHGLELLSPPSSRSDSPFDMADISPRPSSGARAITSPTNNASPLQPTSPLALGVGNRSFDTLSPFASPRPAAAAVDVLTASTTTPTFISAATSVAASPSPFAGPLATDLNPENPATPQSMTSSTYLSLGETTSGDEGGDEDDGVVPIARGMHPSHTIARIPAEENDHGLGLTFIPPNPQAPVSPHLSLSRPQHPTRRSHASPRSHSDIDSMSELSDLDLMSDYAPSEGELIDVGSENGSSSGGRRGPRVGDEAFLSVSPVPSHGYAYESDMESTAESDASWSVAGGSDAGESENPQLTRGGTVRARGGRGARGRM